MRLTDALAAGLTLGAFSPALSAQTCPAGGIDEAGGTCFDGLNPLDDPNGGCPVGPDAFMPLPLGQTVCGRSGFFLSDTGERLADQDWYQVTVAGPEVLELRVDASVALNVGVAEQMTPGLPGCANLTGGFLPFAFVAGGSRGEFTIALPAAGSYLIVVEAFDTGGEVACDSPYTLLAFSSAAPCDDGTGLVTDTRLDVAFGSGTGAPLTPGTIAVDADTSGQNNGVCG